VLNPSLDLEVSYTGQNYDVEAGLYYYNSRYYNPQLGRFIQPDTMIPDPTNLQAYNRYSYVSNNPLKYTDPSGHSWFTSAWNSVFGGGSNGSPSFAGQIMTAGYVNTEGGDISGFRVEITGELLTESPIKGVAQQDKEQALPLAEDGVPSEGFGEVLGVVDYSLDVADAIPVAGDVAEGNLSTLYVPEGIKASGPMSVRALQEKYLSIPANGYLDVNLSAAHPSIPIGLTGGMMVDAKGAFYWYLGGGITTLGIAVTGSPQSVSTGWNAGFQFGYYAGFQLGYSWANGGSSFVEGGMVSPGISLTGYFVRPIPGLKEVIENINSIF